MGYESFLENVPTVKKKSVTKFREIVEAEKKKEEANDLIEYIREIKDDGEIVFEEYYGKFYDDLAFARIIAPFVNKGELILVGEDGQKWGYHFNGKGEIFAIEFVMTISDRPI